MMERRDTVARDDEVEVRYIPFFLRPPSALVERLARVVFSLGMVKGLGVVVA